MTNVEQLSIPEPKATRDIAYAEPVFLRKLVEAHGGTQVEVGDLIGLSGAHVGQALSGATQWRQANELAARYIFEAHYAPKSVEVVAVLRGKAADIAFVQTLADRAGFSVTVLP